MADDIYPLGQGRGLLSDIINFALNNIYQYGQDVATRNKRLRSVQLGQPMPSDLLHDIIGVAPISGAISPINWKSTTPEAKALITMMGNRYPNFFKKVLDAKNEFVNFVLPAERLPHRSLGSHSYIEPSQTMAAASRGAEAPGMSRIFVREDLPSGPFGVPTLAHEWQHGLNVGRRTLEDPADAETIGNLIGSMLPEADKSSLLGLQHRANNFRDLLATEPASKDAQIARDFLPTIQQNIGNEGLAHLAQHVTLNPKSPLTDMAMRLGIDVGGAPAAMPLPTQPTPMDFLRAIVGGFGGGQ